MTISANSGSGVAFSAAAILKSNIGGSSSGSGKDHGNNKRSGKAGALAGTGDANVPLTAAAAALAAAGAGLVAYSARRTALEIDTANEANSDRPR